MKRLFLCTSLLFVGSSVHAAEFPAQTPARLEAGKALYQKNCLACHGEKGDGAGPAGKMMKPKPRDFAHSTFVNGDKPESIAKTISDGLPGTAMAPFKSLSDEERASLAYYVLSLRKK
ncbi:c-type cytochrome [Bdellovibrio sp. HCB209]|uniref:c-type cytochrome n=1 Tax=Bdellovibrio sp. HCB209 TaxID=3394354 RepID=UPI0039B5AC6F